MNIRAVIFDVYNTLLAVGPPPADAAARWTILWQTTVGLPARASLEQFELAMHQIIAREHAAARAQGILHPEVVWPRVVSEILPELNRLPPDEHDEFIFQQMRLRHTLTLIPGAAEVLRTISSHQVLLGLASNAQAYTLRELEAALAPVGLSRQIFNPDLCFYSFEHGYSKPDPQVFRMLTDQLHTRNIAPQATLMVGNNLHHDIEPAKAQDLQTWHLITQPQTLNNHEGDWNQLARWLEVTLR